MEHPSKKLKRSDSKGRRNTSADSSAQLSNIKSSKETKSSSTHNLRRKRSTAVAESSSSQSLSSVAPSSSSIPDSDTEVVQQPSNSTADSSIERKKRKLTGLPSSSKRLRKNALPATTQQQTRPTRSTRITTAKKMDTAKEHDEDLSRTRGRRTSTKKADNEGGQLSLGDRKSSRRGHKAAKKTTVANDKEDESSKRKGKAKAVMSETGSDTRQHESRAHRRGPNQRRPKKQADPEEMEGHTESDMECPAVSYYEYFEDENDEDDGGMEEEEEEEEEEVDQVDLNREAAEDYPSGWEHEHYDDDEDDEEAEMHDDLDEVEELARVRRSLGLQMQSTFDGMLSDITGRLRSILTNLKNDDQTMQLIALQELAEILSVSSEDTLSGFFASDSFVKELVRIMKGSGDILGGMGDDAAADDDMMMALAMSEGLGGGNPELTLLACRCISNLLDALPTAVTSVVYHGAIPVLCQKLKSIDYIDLAEQALSALEKVSSHLPRAVVREGGLGAALMYFDFFSIHSQRTALRTASNCLRGVDTEAFSQVVEIVPTLLNTVNYLDRTVVELSCLCWVRLSESYRNDREHLEKIISVDFLRKIIGLIPVPGNTNAIRPATFSDILRILRVVAKGSPQLGFELLKLNIVDTLYQVLTGTPKAPSEEAEVSAPAHVSLDHKWRDSVQYIIRIFVDVLPPLPKDDIFSSKRFRDNEPISSRTRSAKESPEELSVLKDKISTSSEPDARVKYLQDNEMLLKHIGNLLVPVCLEIYSSTVNLRTRQLVTQIFVKFIHFASPETLRQVLKDVPLPSFLAGILAQKEHASLLVDALFQAELLIKKLPDLYRTLFEREGVLHEIEAIANSPYSEGDEPEHSKSKSRIKHGGDGEEAEKTDASLFLSSQDTHDSNESSGEEHDGEQTKTSTSSDNQTEHHNRRSHFARHDEDNAQGAPAPSRRRLLDRSDIHAILRNRFALTRSGTGEAERGLGQGSTRKYVIQLAQNLIRVFRSHKTGGGQSRYVSTLDEFQKFADGLSGTPEDPCAKDVLRNLARYLQGTAMGISSFELMNSGLLDALLAYLTSEYNGSSSSLVERQRTFVETLLLCQPESDVAGSNNPVRALVLRLQELLSRMEPFEVIAPLESSNGDSSRNPTSMLAKQLRLRLTGQGPNIPVEYQHLMVSTHAVATFKVLEDYLLSRIGNSTAPPSMRKAQRRRKQSQTSTQASESKDKSQESNGEPMDYEDDEQTDGHEDQGDAEDRSSDSNEETTSSAAASQDQAGSWQIRFYLKDTLISNDTTVYGAVHRYELQQNSSSSSMRNIWLMSYPVTYKRVWVPKASEESSETGKSRQPVRQLDNVKRPDKLTDDGICTRVLKLLGVLAKLTKNWLNESTIRAEDFVNRKLTAKMNRQLEEPLIVASSCLPDWTYWLMQEASFLFPFETRYLFIQSTSFGYSRLIARWQSLQARSNNQRDEHNRQEQQPILGRMERQKVRIMRSQMLESAIKILDLFGSSQSVLEIEYTGEEGTGLGPTLEFYAATSKEFCKKSINMWRDDEDDGEGEYVSAKRGLFPKPLVRHNKSSNKVIKLFRTLGQFMAKAMLDFRIIDIPFSPAFFRVALGREEPNNDLLMEIDPVLGKSVQDLQAYIERKRQIYSDKSMSAKEQRAAAERIEVNGARIKDLCLDFTLPGNPNIELKRGGSSVPVTIHNVEEYIERLYDLIMGSGISEQIDAFRRGFDELFAFDDLKILSYEELVSLCGTAKEDWSFETLADAIKADHGFTADSPSFKNLLSILSEMNDEERREFLQFTTGSPRLPIGGWKALRPVFTVVRKSSEAPLTADSYLPSVMTCANYLKMPDYSSKEIMRERLRVSMKEGKNSFLLS